jgi:hypothetical protein
MVAETKHTRFLSAFLFTWAVFHPADKKPDELVLTAYWEALKTFTAEQIVDAFKKSIITFKWFPKPVELIEFMKPAALSIESRAQQQVAHVLDIVRVLGYRTTPVWDDPITARLFQGRFKWQSLCDTLTEEETKWFVKEFIEAYNSFSEIQSHEHAMIDAPEKLKALADKVTKRIE